MVKEKSENSTPEEDFLWSVCAHMEAKGLGAVPVRNADGEFVAVKCDNGIQVPITLEFRLARPHLHVVGTAVLRGGPINKASLERAAEAIKATGIKLAASAEKAAGEQKLLAEASEAVKSLKIPSTIVGSHQVLVEDPDNLGKKKLIHRVTMERRAQFSFSADEVRQHNLDDVTEWVREFDRDVGLAADRLTARIKGK